jgi:twitching motility protein PilT
MQYSFFKDLLFTDLYLGCDTSWISGIPGPIDLVCMPPEAVEEASNLRLLCEEFCREKPLTEDFPLKSNDVSFRVSVMNTITEKVFVLRKLSSAVASITSLGIPRSYINMMMAPDLTGLFIISGAYGQGKTTTASALVAARVATYGGVAVTIEDPPEIPLHGQHGDGICYQTWVGRGGFGHACRQVSRWTPSIIYLGEVRDAETAIEAMRAAINGKLVICTTHADNCSMAIERIFSLANNENSSADDILGMLATGLTAVVHQKLEKVGNKKQLTLEPLFITGEDAQGARNTIRLRKFDQLKSLIQLQKNRLLMSGNKTFN